MTEKFEPLYEKLRALGGGLPGSPAYTVACAAIDAIRSMDTTLENIGENSMFSDKDTIVKYARSRRKHALGIAGIQKDQA